MSLTNFVTLLLVHPLSVMFLSVKVKPNLAFPRDADTSLAKSGSKVTTLYWGRPVLKKGRTAFNATRMHPSNPGTFG